jgi:hypothetical protein
MYKGRLAQLAAAYNWYTGRLAQLGAANTCDTGRLAQVTAVFTWWTGRLAQLAVVDTWYRGRLAQLAAVYLCFLLLAGVHVTGQSQAHLHNTRSVSQRGNGQQYRIPKYLYFILKESVSRELTRVKIVPIDRFS